MVEKLSLPDKEAINKQAIEFDFDEIQPIDSIYNEWKDKPLDNTDNNRTKIESFKGTRTGIGMILSKFIRNKI